MIETTLKVMFCIMIISLISAATYGFASVDSVYDYKTCRIYIDHEMYTKASDCMCNNFKSWYTYLPGIGISDQKYDKLCGKIKIKITPFIAQGV